MYTYIYNIYFYTHTYIHTRTNRFSGFYVLWDSFPVQSQQKAAISRPLFGYVRPAVLCPLPMLPWPALASPSPGAPRALHGSSCHYSGRTMALVPHH